MNRSYLFAPGHNEKLVGKVFDAGADADAVILDLEDAVRPEHKVAARRNVAKALWHHSAWVRINAARTPLAEADLHAIAALAHGIRIPKVESVDDVRWVVDRAPGKPLICAIESAMGVANAIAIAAAKSAETGHSECPVSIQLAVLAMNLAVDESAAESQCS